MLLTYMASSVDGVLIKVSVIVVTNMYYSTVLEYRKYCVLVTRIFTLNDKENSSYLYLKIKVL